MAKYALLIGTSEYQSQHIPPLKGVTKDIQAMQRVLLDSNIGGFDDVQLLLNEDSNIVRSHIEQLFMEKCQKNDIVLLYLSGHGYTYEDGNLFFISHNTETNPQGKPRVGTAIGAKFIHEHYMSFSKAKRQVLILDCCFSGAFAQDMNAKQATAGCIKDEIEQQLGGEGRAVLTSSTSTQVSFEDAAGGIYTQYLVEGIEKGAADADNDGVITVDELHQYAKRKVQEAKPAMQPEIYAIREGYRIRVANAPVSTELEYRKVVEQCVKDNQFSVADNCFKVLGRRLLSRKQIELRLNEEKAEEIKEQVLQPIREFQQSLQEYEEVLVEALEEEPVLGDGDWNILQRLQQSFGLRDEDVASIHERLIPQQQPVSNNELILQAARMTAIHATKMAATSILAKQMLLEEDVLSSEKGVNYTKLRDLLKAHKWKEADKETYLVMIQAVGKKEGDWFEPDELLNFPCTDLRTIDNLWVKYSDGHFGFSVQKIIYLEVGGKTDGEYDEATWNKFGDSIGWRVENSWVRRYSQFTFDTSSPRGHLPGLTPPVVHGRISKKGIFLLSHRNL